MKLSELMDGQLLTQMLTEGYVKSQVHPTLPYVIYNYTPKSQYENVWNDVTRKCRGLIVDTRTSEVVARPFEKFFNYEQVADEHPVEPFEVYEKMDGSLGILYPDGDGWAIATRGSFTSDQALHATAVLTSKYKEFEPARGFTYLFEIIYPSNRVVVNYGDMDDLVLIDVIHTDTGTSLLEFASGRWPGQVVERFDGLTPSEVLKGQRENREGYVIKFESGYRMKVKHAEYVRLHRIVTNVNAKVVWRYLSEDQDLTELLDNVPDEFYQWVRDTARELHQKFAIEYRAIRRAYVQAVKDVLISLMRREEPAGDVSDAEYRKVFAARVASSPYKAELFTMLDKKSVDKAIWKRLTPTAERPFMRQSEDAD